MKFPIIISDNPLWYNDQRKERKDGSGPTRGIGACHHYDQMKTPEIAALAPYVQSVAADRCHLYMWATMPLLPDVMHIMAAWGWVYVTTPWVWVKLYPKKFEEAIVPVSMKTLCDTGRNVLDFMDSLTVYGPGYYTASNVEILLLGIRRKRFRSLVESVLWLLHPWRKPIRAKPFKPLEPRSSQVVYHTRLGHSEKPDIFQHEIARMYPDITPRLELFGRRDLPGWTVVGNEAPDTYGEDIRISLDRLANTS